MKFSEQNQVERISKDRRSLEFELREQLPSYLDHTSLVTKTLGDKPLRAGGIGQTNRMLVTLGMAITSGNKSMIEFGITRALNHGATEVMILDVFDIAILHGGGAAVSSVRFAYTALKHRINNIEGSENYLMEAESEFYAQKAKGAKKVS